jgi:hypothetical protein
MAQPSGTVKVNSPSTARCSRRTRVRPDAYGGTIVLAESLDDVEGAYQEAVAGRPATSAVRRRVHSRAFDRRWRPRASTW